MATTPDLSRVAAIVLHYLRPPLLLLIAVYAVGVIGMALIPGRPVDGQPVHMSLFHAFYFFTYSLTTTGFGEIPNEFSDAQRLWAIFCLFTGVVAWLYAIGSIIRLVQNPHLFQAVVERRFAYSTRRISEPFFVICGFGDTGSLLARGLSAEYLTAVVIDTDSERIKALALRDYKVAMPRLCADASVPKHLIDAGVKQPNCRAVVALTGDENTNLKIAVMTRSLNPSVRVICRSTSSRHKAYLKSLGLVDAIDPFLMFAEQIGKRITTPLLHVLGDWLVGAHGIRLDYFFPIPRGTWILCSYGRMGHSLHDSFAQREIPTVVIDPRPVEVTGAVKTLHQDYDLESLREAGIEQATGIVAGTKSDADNLEILLSARTLNPSAYSIVRQNNHENHLAFDSASANLIMQPSLITARKILLLLISPHIQDLMKSLEEADQTRTTELIERLITAVGEERPILWYVRADTSDVPALSQWLESGRRLTLGDFIRDPRQRELSLPCVPLALTRGEHTTMLPADSEPLAPADEILFCGTRHAEHLLESTGYSPHTLEYLVTGENVPRGYLFRWLYTKLGHWRGGSERLSD